MYSNKTIDIKGAENVIVNTYGSEKKHVTCILAIAGGGKKLIPTLIFKGEPDKNIELRYQQLDVVKNKKIKIYCQANAWCNDYIFHKWLNDVFYNYEEFILKQKCILIMDKAPSHIKSNIINELIEKQKYFIYIPAGLIRFLQPLDVGINKPFKDYLKSEYLADLAKDLFKNEDDSNLLIGFKDDKKVSNLDIQRLIIIQWVVNIWWDDEKIKEKSIINSSDKTIITFPLDGSKDNDYEFPEEVLEQYNNDSSFNK